GPKNGGFSCSGQQNVPDSERNISNDVPDTERNTPPNRNGKNPINSTVVPDVPDVPDLAGNGGRVCAQCNAGWGSLAEIDGVSLHAATCLRFWRKDHPADDGIPWGPFSRWPEDGLDIPPSLQVANRKVPLDRRPPLGPEGDSLDDFK